MPGGVAPKLGSEKVSRYTGVSQLQLRVSHYTVQLSLGQTRLPLCDIRRNLGLSLTNPGSSQGPPDQKVFVCAFFLLDHLNLCPSAGPCREEEKAYTTTTERILFEETFSRPVVDTKTLRKPGKPFLPPKSFLCGPHFFSAKEKFCTGAGRCMLSFSRP